MTNRSSLSKVLLAGIFPLLIGISSCSTQEEGVVNSRDDLDSSVIGKFNCNTGEFKLTKYDPSLSDYLEKNKWYSKEDFILAAKNNFESYGTAIYKNPSKLATEQYRIRVMRSNCN